MGTKRTRVKKAVKKKVVAKQADIFNMDIVRYFTDGVEEKVGHLEIRGDILYCDVSHSKEPDVAEVAVAVKIGDYTLINGDDVEDAYGYFSESVEELQDFEEDEITTSFKCLKNAGVDLHKIKVLAMSKDVAKSSNKGNDNFDDFENNIPQGATYSQHPVGSDQPDIKRYHRAGSLLLKAGKKSFICGMDESSYFVTQLPTNPKTIDNAFKALKPQKVIDWEKKSGKVADRQGEWFFVPVSVKKPKGMRKKGLPLWKEGGNKHMVSKYVQIDGINYVQGSITHVDHEITYLKDGVTYEAIMNTAEGSWSEQGVD